MDGRLILLIPATILVACAKENDTPGVHVPAAVEHGFTMEEVVGYYHGPYAFWSTGVFGQGSSSFNDTGLMVIEDTFPGWNTEVIKAGYQTFGLNEDGTLTPYFNVGQFSGGFHWVGDTLKLEWHNVWNGDFGDFGGSSFDGGKY